MRVRKLLWHEPRSHEMRTAADGDISLPTVVRTAERIY